MPRTAVLLFILVLFFFDFSFAEKQNSKALCNAEFTQTDFQNKILFRENRLSFINPEGPLSTGLCWWHSLFQQKALHLARFFPGKPKPQKRALANIAQDIWRSHAIVEIPGYKNLFEFSKDNQQMLEKYLFSYQLESVLNFDFLRGLESFQLSQEKMISDLQNLYYMVHHEKKVVFQILQLPGVQTHAWLVIEMNQYSWGYELLVVDSNFLQPQRVHYFYGDTTINTAYGPTVPQIVKSKFLNRFPKIAKNYCDRGITANSIRNLESSR